MNDPVMRFKRNAFPIREKKKEEQLVQEQKEGANKLNGFSFFFFLTFTWLCIFYLV